MSIKEPGVSDKFFIDNDGWRWYNFLVSKIMDEVIKARKPKIKYSVLKEIGERFSPRLFSDQKLPVRDINKIFEAARLAPSARNRQPWFFYWTRRGSVMHAKLLSTLSDNNHWAISAPILIVCTCEEKNEFGLNEYARYDLGAAVISMILEAGNLGYYARQMGLFDKDAAGKIVGLREGQKAFVIVALGKIGDYDNAPEDIIERDLIPSTRKDLIAEEI